VAVVFLTCYTDQDIFQAARRVGLSGYVLKWRLLSDLVPAVKLALSGACFVSPGIG